MHKVALVGTGLIGQGWAIVFARAGWNVSLFDAALEAAETALDVISVRLADLQSAGLVADAQSVRQRIMPAASLAEAVAGALWVQESVAEAVAAKQAVFAEVDRLAGGEAILASSTSTIPPSQFTEKLARRQRCLVAHPINPPYLVPLVELVPAPWTAADTLARAREFMSTVGQAPIVLKREIQGFVVNRLQGALLHEAFRLVDDGLADVEEIDIAIREGLGLRWSFMGPFETIDLNAPGGLSDYVARYGEMYFEMAQSQADPRRWQADLLSRIDAARRALLPKAELPARQAWRDRRLMALAAHKQAASTLPL